MAFRISSALLASFGLWAAWVQGNDPDPARWIAMYLSLAIVATLGVLGRPAPRLALLLAVVALAWAAAIVPELIGRWRPSDLGASMTTARPEVEYGRELGGLLIIAVYALVARVCMRAPQREAVR